MQKKVYLILVLVIALVLGVWTASPALSSAAQFAPAQNSDECRQSADQLTGALAEIPQVDNRIRQICDFNVRLDQLNENISESDRMFVEHAIIGNMLEIQSLEYALQRVTNPEYRGLIEVMIAMHTHDLDAALSVAERLDIDTEFDLTEVHVYPQTPEFDLGIRRVNLEAKFLDPLMMAGGGGPIGTPTVVPTDGTGTLIPTTGTATLVPTTDGTGTVTLVPTIDATGTPTVIPTDGTTTVTASSTLVATDTATLVPTSTATDTATALPTLTATDTATAIPTVDTGTATTVPPTLPPGGGVSPNFDMVSVHIIEDMHVMHVSTGLAAQRLVQNDEIRAMAKHATDVAGLHLLLLHDLKHRLFDNYTPPTPEIQKEYQSPRRFEPAGD
ncbi:MAG TPA: hypothetical protein VK897_14475 [Anaerolineales bacterium]|nr:hypothetical protein [Anaerolineales bacterium]